MDTLQQRAIQRMEDRVSAAKETLFPAIQRLFARGFRCQQSCYEVSHSLEDADYCMQDCNARLRQFQSAMQNGLYGVSMKFRTCLMACREQDVTAETCYNACENSAQEVLETSRVSMLESAEKIAKSFS